MITTLHLTNAYHPTSGGIRTFYHALLDAAPAANRRVVLVVPGESTRRVDLGQHGAIYYIRGAAAPAFDRRYRLMLPHRYFPIGGSAIVRVLRAEQPALVEIADKYSLPYIAAMLRKGWFRHVRRPALVGLSCERFDDNMRAYLSGSTGAAAFTRWYLRHVYGPPFDAHLAVSSYTADELRDALWDRADDFIRVVTMGVDTEAFGPHHRSETLRRRLLERAGGTPESVLLLYAGRLSPEKHVTLLLDALAALRGDGRDYRLVLAGDGPSAASLLEQASADLRSRMHFCGHLDRSEVPAYCASADVFVHPNPREPFGIGPLEAMASGVPVVLPAAGGVLEYATERNAWLAEPTGLPFAAAIRRAAASGGERIAAAMTTAVRFTWSRATRRYFDTYDELAVTAS